MRIWSTWRLASLMAAAALGTAALPTWSGALWPRIRFEAIDLGPLFSRANSAVLGLDGAFSIPLGQRFARRLQRHRLGKPGRKGLAGRSLWVFGDTLIGSWLPDHLRKVDIMPSTTAAVVSNSDWRTGFSRARFLGGRTPRALLDPVPQGERLWPLDWVPTPGRLGLYYVAIAPTGAGALDFKVLGSGLARPARREPLRMAPGPLMWPAGTPTFGGSALARGRWIYVYAPGRPTYLARVRPGQVARAVAYLYWQGQGIWGTNPKDAAALPSSGPEASVRYDAYLGRFVMVYIGLHEIVQIRFAPEPWGPWTAPRDVCRCQPVGDPQATCYGAKEHLELERGGGRTIFLTYNTNTTPALVDRRPDLYWPHLVSLSFETR